MRYDLKLLHELCQESGLSNRISSDLRVEVDLGENCTLFFENFDGEDDCMVGFDGAVSHGHGDFIFAGRGCTAELNYLDVITGLKDGTVLICERWLENKLHDRWLIHRDFNDEFKYMEEGEEIRVLRSVTSVVKREATP